MNNRQWKSLGLAYFALVALLTPTLASAYIDPSVTSYVLQAVVGVAVAAGAFFAVYWRRAKKKLQEKKSRLANRQCDISDTFLSFPYSTHLT